MWNLMRCNLRQLTPPTSFTLQLLLGWPFSVFQKVHSFGFTSSKTSFGGVCWGLEKLSIWALQTDLPNEPLRKNEEAKFSILNVRLSLSTAVSRCTPCKAFASNWKDACCDLLKGINIEMNYTDVSVNQMLVGMNVRNSLRCVASKNHTWKKCKERGTNSARLKQKQRTVKKEPWAMKCCCFSESAVHEEWTTKRIVGVNMARKMRWWEGSLCYVTI